MQKYREIRDITKEYKDMFRVIKYDEPFYIPTEQYEKQESKKQKKEEKNEDNIQRSARRSRSVINDYVINNDFDIFATFTFDPAKVNRYDVSFCYMTMQTFLATQRRKARLAGTTFRYIVVPEKHKDGAIHFHALIGNYPSPLTKTRFIKNNKRVYNANNFRYGHTILQYLNKEDYQKTTAYICKYITKDMATLPNKRRYWSSRNLDKPVHHINKLLTLGLTNKLNPGAMTYKSDYYEVYEFKKEENK